MSEAVSEAVSEALSDPSTESPALLVVGEALIDAVERGDDPPELHVGGSPANVAFGLGALDHDVSLATWFGRDDWGRRIADRCVEMGAKVAPIPTEDRPRDGLDQRPLHFSDQIAAQEVRTTGTVFPRTPGPVIEKGRELRVYLVEIAGWILVQDDDVGAQPFHAPVLLRLKNLTHERHIVVADDPHEQDGQITGNTVGP